MNKLIDKFEKALPTACGVLLLISVGLGGVIAYRTGDYFNRWLQKIPTKENYTQLVNENIDLRYRIEKLERTLQSDNLTSSTQTLKAD